MQAFTGHYLKESQPEAGSDPINSPFNNLFGDLSLNLPVFGGDRLTSRPLINLLVVVTTL